MDTNWNGDFFGVFRVWTQQVDVQHLDLLLPGPACLGDALL